METATLILLIGIALTVFPALVVSACVVKSARMSQGIAEDASLKVDGSIFGERVGILGAGGVGSLPYLFRFSITVAALLK